MSRKYLGDNHLSPRQIQLVKLICKGLGNKQIAYEMHVSDGTAKEYLSRIFQRVGVSNRTELAIWAIKNDIVKPHNPTSQIIDTQAEGVSIAC